jgi:phosphatidylinositol alpha-mannosyltransferase
MPAEVRAFVQGHDFDILHLHGPFPPNLSYWALRYSRTTNVATFHSTRFSFRAPGSSLFRWAFRNWYRKLDGLIAVSMAARDSIRPYIPGDYRIVPNGVDTDRFTAGSRPLPEFSGPEPKILFLGRLDPRKGLEQLLRAFPLVRQAIPEVLLLVVGKDPEERRYRRIAFDGGFTSAVRFLGFVPPERLPSCYASCDVYCSPALGGESFGIVLIEAMASGRPVVASDIPGYREVVKNGENGLLVDPHDPSGLAAVLVRLLRDPTLRRTLAARGLESVSDYSWVRVSERIEALYREMRARTGERGRSEIPLTDSASML